MKRNFLLKLLILSFIYLEIVFKAINNRNIVGKFAKNKNHVNKLNNEAIQCGNEVNNAINDIEDIVLVRDT